MSDETPHSVARAHDGETHSLESPILFRLRASFLVIGIIAGLLWIGIAIDVEGSLLVRLTSITVCFFLVLVWARWGRAAPARISRAVLLAAIGSVLITVGPEFLWWLAKMPQRIHEREVFEARVNALTPVVQNEWYLSDSFIGHETAEFPELFALANEVYGDRARPENVYAFELKGVSRNQEGWGELHVRVVSGRIVAAEIFYPVY